MLTVRSFTGYLMAGSVSVGSEAEGCLSTAPLPARRLQRQVYFCTRTLEIYPLLSK